MKKSVQEGAVIQEVMQIVLKKKSNSATNSSETSKKNFFPHCVHNIRGFVTTSRDKILSNQNHFEQ